MNIVVIEDSLPVQRLLVRRLEEAGLTVAGTAVAAEPAVQMVRRVQPDVVLLDLKLTPGSGLWVLSQLRTNGCDAKIFVFSSEDRETHADLCLQRGADGFFDKAQDLDQLLGLLGQMAQGA